MESREGNELFGISLANREMFAKLFWELVSLNMWIIVRACERVFEDENRRDSCLDILHRNIYERFIREEGEGDEEFTKWNLTLASKYIEYSEALDENQGATGMMNLTSVIYRNLHSGDALPDVFIQFEIGLYTAERIKVLEKLVEQYKVK